MPKRHTFNQASYALLPSTSVITYLFPGSRPAQLSPAEFEQIDSLLTKSVAALNAAQEKDYQEAVGQFPDWYRNQQNYIIDLPAYKKQVVAVLNARGEKEVWVNCFCSDHQAADWRQQEVSVEDGGNCFFNLKINLATSRCYDIMVNGVA